MKFTRYSTYRETGEEWLGHVPAHWQVKAIKQLSPVLRGASPRPIEDPKYFDDEGEYSWVRITDVSASKGLLRHTQQRLSKLGSSSSVKLEPGALFVSIAGTVGKPCISAIKACIHDGFVYFPRLSINPMWLYWIFEGAMCYAGLGKWGTQLNLNTDIIGSIRIAVPPADELAAVLTFLSLEIGKIDALIREQQKMISVLQRKRTVLISHVVTKGLIPCRPTRDSGIEWMGQVPAHWPILPLKHLVRFKSGGTPDKAKPELWDGAICWASPKDLKGEYLQDTEDHITDAAVSCGYAELIDPPSVLVVVRGMILARTFPVISANVAVAINQDLKAVIPKTDISPEYLAWLFRGAEPAILGCLDEAAHGTKALRMDRWGSMPLPVPPMEEQLQIADHLRKTTSLLDNLIAEAERAIALLQERRTALISAAVTGKIDVRATTGAAA